MRAVIPGRASIAVGVTAQLSTLSALMRGTLNSEHQMAADYQRLHLGRNYRTALRDLFLRYSDSGRSPTPPLHVQIPPSASNDGDLTRSTSPLPSAALRYPTPILHQSPCSGSTNLSCPSSLVNKQWAQAGEPTPVSPRASPVSSRHALATPPRSPVPTRLSTLKEGTRMIGKTLQRVGSEMSRVGSEISMF